MWDRNSGTVIDFKKQVYPRQVLLSHDRNQWLVVGIKAKTEGAGRDQLYTGGTRCITYRRIKNMKIRRYEVLKRISLVPFSSKNEQAKKEIDWVGGDTHKIKRMSFLVNNFRGVSQEVVRVDTVDNSGGKINKWYIY
jgi:hypothetical protein